MVPQLALPLVSRQVGADEAEGRVPELTGEGRGQREGETREEDGRKRKGDRGKARNAMKRERRKRGEGRVDGVSMEVVGGTIIDQNGFLLSA